MGARRKSARARRRRVALASAVVALLVAGVVTYFFTRSTPHRHSVARRPIATVAPKAKPPPSPSPVANLIPDDVVPGSRPVAMTLTGRQFTIHAHVCAMANIRPYDPPGEQHHTVCWVREGFGVRPSSNGATSYLFGHSWAPDTQEVLNQASARATRDFLHAQPRQLDGVTIYPTRVLDGYHLVLRTRTGVLTYEVRRVYGVRKLDLGSISSWLDETVRDRVLLTTCAEWNGRDYDYNVVIEAYLVSSKRLVPAKVG